MRTEIWRPGGPSEWRSSCRFEINKPKDIAEAITRALAAGSHSEHLRAWQHNVTDLPLRRQDAPAAGPHRGPEGACQSLFWTTQSPSIPTLQGEHRHTI